REAEAPRGSARAEPVEPSIQAFLDVVWRRRVLFFGVFITMLVAAVTTVFAITPRYTAEARVMIDAREENVVGIQAVLSGLAADDPTIRSEIEVLRSEDLAQRVIAQTNLDQSREFNPFLSPSFVSHVLQSVDWPWLNAAFGEILMDRGEALRNSEVRAEVVAAYFDRLAVDTVGRNTRVIGISFTSERPEVAAWVANTAADTYVALQVESKLAATERAGAWLGERLREVGGNVTALEQAVDDMRAARAAAGGWDPDLLEQQISQVNSQLMQSRADHEQAEAELRQIDSLVAARGPEAVFEVVDPQLLVWTNEQIMWLRRTQAELRAAYGADHPAVAEMRDAIRQLIEDTSARLIASVRNRVKVSADKVQALEQELRRLVDESIATRRGQAQLRIAEREAEATAELYETLLARSKETAQTGLEQPDARIISRASVPLRPSYPNRLLLLGVAVLGSIALSGTLVGLAEGIERGYRSSDQLKRSVPLPVLGEIPWVGGHADRDGLAELLLTDPAGAYAESLRTIALSLELSGDPTDHGKLFLITSSVPKEGKTTIVTCLARTIALLGRKVLVVDCDLRRPNCHTQLHLSRAPGLSSYLSDQALISDVIQKDRASGVDLVSGGEVKPNPLQLLRSDKFPQLLRDLRPRYDVIFLDAPPLLPIADTRLLSALVDRCVLVVRWRTTARESVLRAIEQIRQAGGRPAGLVLTQVKDQANHGYGYYYASYRAALDEKAS
ncbi:MAG: GumC family protein, partial [Geminicoccaceae bacterium]